MSKLSPRQWRLPPGHLHRQCEILTRDKSQIQITSGCPVFSFLTLWLTPNSVRLSGNNVETCSTQIMIIYRFPLPCSPCPHFMTMYWLYSDMCSHNSECVSHDHGARSSSLLSLVWTIHRLSSPPRDPGEITTGRSFLVPLVIRLNWKKAHIFKCYLYFY